jgi:hypothetical protein
MSYVDWNNIKLEFRTTCFWTDTCYQTTSLGSFSVPEGPDERTYDDVLAGTDTDADGVSNVIDNCPSLADPSQENLDGDPFGDLCDCKPADPAGYPGAVESNDGEDNQCPGDEGYGLIDEVTGDRFATRTTYSWDVQVE